MKLRSRVFVVRAALVLPLASLALAQPPRMAALSDLQPQWGDAGSECPKPDQLGVSFSNLTDPDRDVQTQSGQAALGQNISGGMIETIAALEETKANLKRRLEELGTHFFSSPSCTNAVAWREAALPSFQAVDSALRDVYSVAWRSSATLTSRFSDPAYRNVAVLNLRSLYYNAVREVFSNAQTYLSNLSAASGFAVCGAGSTPTIGALATPQIPAACTSSAAPATPAKGWRLALSCDRTEFNFANPPWMDRFQILRDSSSPLTESQLDSRLAVFVPGGFVRLTDEATVMDAGVNAPGGNWSFTWNASSGGVGLASSEAQFGPN